MKLFNLFLKFQWKQLILSTASIVAALVFFGVILFSLYNGQQEISKIIDNHASISKNLAKKEVALFAAIERNEANLTPYDVGGKSAKRFLFKEVDAFSALSLGLSKVFPSEFSISLRDKGFSILDESSKIENPLLLSLGNFDFSFVMVWLLPLFVIALSFNLLSKEIEMGTFPILTSQAVGVQKIVWLKALAQYTLFSIFLLGCCLIAFALIQPDVFSNISAPAYLLGSLLLYTLFWFVISALVNLLRRSSLTNISLLFSIWLVLVLIIPTALSMIADGRNPVPSRIQLVNDLRTATQEIDNDAATLLNNYYFDHPELAPKSEKRSMKSYVYKNALKRKMIHEVASPVVADYYSRLSQQAAFLNGFKFLSPALLFQSVIDDLSENTLEDFIVFHQAADNKRLEWNNIFEDKIFKDETMTKRDIIDLPKYGVY